MQQTPLADINPHVNMMLIFYGMKTTDDSRSWFSAVAINDGFDLSSMLSSFLGRKM